jgi:uncharacterized protein YndB with AHSA1/START domain
MTTETAAAPGLHLVRTVATPPEQAFRAWIDPDLLAVWWWPKAAWATTYEIDPRVGGRYRFATTGLPDDDNFAVSGEFREVRPPDLLAYTWHWEGEPSESVVTVRFVDHSGATEIVLDHDRMASDEEADRFRQGWESVLARLVELLSPG